jgi:glycosyltransferase involved in cell wall biosynthesis
MRILHITPDYYPAMGGGELYVKEISERLASRGHDVTVLAMNSRGLVDQRGKRLPGSNVINRVTVKRLHNTYKIHHQLTNMKGGLRALSLALSRNQFELLRISPYSLRAFLYTLGARVDVVGVANWFHGSLAHQTAFARGLKDFVFVGIPFFHTEYPYVHAPVFRQMLGRCDAVLALTEHEKEFIEAQATGANARVVGAGVEPALFAQPDGDRIRAMYGIGDAPLVGYVGRVSRIKGVVTLLQAMRMVWRNNPRVRLLLAGSGFPSSAQCEDEIRDGFSSLSEGERARIICVENFADAMKPSLFDALDIFAMPSLAESFGISYLEAWMCRKPVIGARIASTACVIRDGVDGLLVAPKDAEALAVTILDLSVNANLRQQMGRAGYERTVAHYTWQKVVDRVEQVYDAACRNRRGGAARR